MKVCKYCSEEKSIERFSWKNKEKGIIQNKCKDCHRLYLRQHYKKNPNTYLISNNKIKINIKQFINKIKSVPCMDCKIIYPPYVMDFDHREDEKKLFIISKGHINGNLKMVEKEISKCDVVCSNCHRERTYQRSQIRSCNPNG